MAQARITALELAQLVADLLLCPAIAGGEIRRNADVIAAVFVIVQNRTLTAAFTQDQ